MSAIVTNSSRARGEHFQPEAALDPQQQRRMRGYLERIDVTAFEANRAMFGKICDKAELATFEHLAQATAQARAAWVKLAMVSTLEGKQPSAEDIARLAQMRQTYHELSEAYEALRRAVERGYLRYKE